MEQYKETGLGSLVGRVLDRRRTHKLVQQQEALQRQPKRSAPASLSMHRFRGLHFGR